MKALFRHKPESIKEITPRDEYTIEKTITLSADQFSKFEDNLLEDQDFITENVDLMYTDKNNVLHCILVTSEDADHGILVESEGYDYARYAAYLPKEYNK